MLENTKGYCIELDNDFISSLRITHRNNDESGTFKINAYNDDKNKILHIFDSLNHNSKSIINLLNSEFVIKLLKKLKVKKKDYEVYIYTPPIFDESIIVAFDYKTNNFYAYDKSKIYETFARRSNVERDLLI